MKTLITPSGWTFLPGSRVDFSERARNVARFLGKPLQQTQEFLARVFGFANAHALYANIDHVIAEPKRYPAGPFVGITGTALHPDQKASARLRATGVRFLHDSDRETHLLHAVAAFCTGSEELRSLPHRLWDMREIDLFGCLESHRVRFARVRDKWRVLDGFEAARPRDAADDYAHLQPRESGRATLLLTPIGQAIVDALYDLDAQFDIADRHMSNDAYEVEAVRLFAEAIRIARYFASNPWAQGYIAVLADRRGGIAKAGALEFARRALNLFSGLYGGKLHAALPASHYCGWRVDNGMLPRLLWAASQIAASCGDDKLSGRWSRLYWTVMIDEPDALTENNVSM